MKTWTVYLSRTAFKQLQKPPQTIQDLADLAITDWKVRVPTLQDETYSRPLKMYTGCVLHTGTECATKLAVSIIWKLKYFTQDIVKRRTDEP